VDPREYRNNRSLISPAELAPYNGKWVAFSLDGRRVIASDEDLGALDKLIVKAGADPARVALERIELDDVYLGGAEVL
jgi:hypothetical protein